MIWRAALALASRGRLPILIFHRVLAEPDPFLPHEPSADQFEALLAHIAKRFNVLPLVDAARRLHEGTLPPRALAITFDDGYANNLSIAAPILKRYGMPATIFVATGYLVGRWMWNDGIIEALRRTRHATLDLNDLNLGVVNAATLEQRRAAIATLLPKLKPQSIETRERVARDILARADVSEPSELMLDPSSVRALAQFDVDVGAHTVNHPILAAVSSDVARREIEQSRRDLEAIVGHAIEVFAYPNGHPGRDYTAEHVHMVRKAGFSFAVSTAWGAGTRAIDRWQLPRFTPWTWRPLKFDLLMVRNLQRPAPLAVATS